MIDLQLYGWNEALCQLKQEIGGSGLSHGRVMITHKTCYRIVSENGIYICELSGNGKDRTAYLHHLIDNLVKRMNTDDIK